MDTVNPLSFAAGPLDYTLVQRLVVEAPAGTVLVEASSRSILNERLELLLPSGRRLEPWLNVVAADGAPYGETVLADADRGLLRHYNSLVIGRSTVQRLPGSTPQFLVDLYCTIRLPRWMRARYPVPADGSGLLTADDGRVFDARTTWVMPGTLRGYVEPDVLADEGFRVLGILHTKFSKDTRDI